MAHTLDHEEEIYKIQRDIEKRDSRHLNTGQKHKPYAAKMSLLGNMPGETTSTKGQEQAIGLVKSILPDPTDPKEVAELFVDMKQGAMIGSKWGSKGGPKGAAIGGAVGGLTYPIGKRLAREVLPTLDEVLEPVMRGFRGPQWQPALAGVGSSNIPVKGADKFTPSNVFQAKSLEKIAGSGPAPGALQLEGLRERVLSGASQSNLEKYLNTDYSKALNRKYKDGRGLYYSPKTLSKNKELLNQIVEKHENIGRLHFNYKMSNSDVNQRKLYDEIGRNYFNNAALVYGNNKARDALVNVSHWLTKDHWHHIFGNKEVGEGLLSVIAQDPLVGVNIARHMHKLKLHSSGIAENIAIIKEFGHKQFHDFLRAAGFEGKFGRSAPLAINEHLQEVSKLATKGTTYTEKAGPGLAGKVVEADPSYVNEIFTLLDQYSEVNTFMKKLMKKGNVWFDPVSKKIVPKNTEGAIMFNFRAQRYGKDTPIEFLNERIGRVTDIYELNK